jgi:hypothetical protein
MIDGNLSEEWNSNLPFPETKAYCQTYSMADNQPASVG